MLELFACFVVLGLGLALVWSFINEFPLFLACASVIGLLARAAATYELRDSIDSCRIKLASPCSILG